MKDDDGGVATETVLDSGEYSLDLFNVDFNLEITDELVARASTSRTVTRANYNDIKGGTTTSSIYGLAGHGASRGEPSLKPIESSNLDISVEWYY
jgi:outer membrane receptor protein involved in Fe transport